MTALPEELREAVEALPTVVECEEWIADAQRVLDNPDEYDVEVQVDARRSRSQWLRTREWAVALATLTAYLSRQHELLREAEEALSFYGDERTYTQPTPWGGRLLDTEGLWASDTGRRARSWLARYREQEEGQ